LRFVGKTRLAIAVGEAELPHCNGGVWFVDLTAVARSADVTSAIAAALGFTVDGPDRTALVIGYLADRQALVILDNCEHVIDECAEFADRFLRAAGDSCLLATSREPLDIDGERTMPLLPLPSGTPDSPGVRLFVDRVSAVKADFALNDSNAATVAAICERLDGLPLAIELAAARVTVMTPSELLAGLGDRFELLSVGRRRQRERTIEATIDWSYDLLDDVEKAVLRTLGVFVDGFDLPSVAAVTELTHRSATSHLEALLSKSLVVRADRGDVARFRLLETVKAYAEDRLVEAHEAHQVRDRHLDHFHGLASPRGPSLMGTIGVGRRLRDDASNVSTAFEWAMATDRPMIGAELITGATMAYFLGVRLSELRAMLDRCTARFDDLADELRGCVAQQSFFCVGMLDDWAAVGPALHILSNSPVASLRAQGFAGQAWVATFANGAIAAELLERSDAEMELAAASDEADLRDVISSFRAWAHAVHEMLHGDCRDGLRHAQAGLATSLDSDARHFFHVDLTAVAAVCQLLLS
jgi:predicted ATPase